MSYDEDHARCWDCGNDSFKITWLSDGVRAECTECGGRMQPSQLYRPEPNSRESYSMEMER